MSDLDKTNNIDIEHELAKSQSHCIVKFRSVLIIKIGGYGKAEVPGTGEHLLKNNKS